MVPDPARTSHEAVAEGPPAPVMVRPAGVPPSDATVPGGRQTTDSFPSRSIGEAG
jgi:hypothetical protein